MTSRVGVVAVYNWLLCIPDTPVRIVLAERAELSRLSSAISAAPSANVIPSAPTTGITLAKPSRYPSINDREIEPCGIIRKDSDAVIGSPTSFENVSSGFIVNPHIPFPVAGTLQQIKADMYIAIVRSVPTSFTRPHTVQSVA